MPLYDLIIVGAGPAGMTAAIYAARADLTVLMLDKLAPGGQIINTNEIQNYTGFDTINGAELAIKMFEHTQSYERITFDYRTVVAIRDKGPLLKEVVCEEDGAVFQGKTVLIATGTRHRVLEVPGEDRFTGNGISWCAVCDGEQMRGKDCVVIGGGNSAVEESLFLADIVKSLTIVTMLGLTADPLACDRLRQKENVKIYVYQDILSFEGEGKITGVRVKDNDNDKDPKFGPVDTADEKLLGEHVIPCDGVFEFIGLVPTTEFCQDLGILDRGYVKADDHMRTAVPGVFAAGDVIVKFLRQSITACSDGAIAGQEAAHYIQAHQG